jgi:hypothetical protein
VHSCCMPAAGWAYDRAKAGGGSGVVTTRARDPFRETSWGRWSRTNSAQQTTRKLAGCGGTDIATGRALTARRRLIDASQARHVFTFETNRCREKPRTRE